MLYLDHIIWTGDDIETVSEKYGSEFAVKSVKGGEHEAWGTYNYLTFFSNSCYIEWLGVRDRYKASQLDHPLIQHLLHTLERKEQGPFQFALRTDKIEAYVEHFTRNSIPFHGPFEGYRKKPNGQLLSWRMLFPAYDFTNQEVLPFLIEWDQPENERIEASLINHQTINAIHYSGTTKERFKEIYQLPTKRRTGKNRLLRNTKIHFHDDVALAIDVT